MRLLVLITAQTIKYFVTKYLMSVEIYKSIREFTQEKNHIHANSVSRGFQQLETKMTTREDIRMTNLIFVILLITAQQNIIAGISS